MYFTSLSVAKAYLFILIDFCFRQRLHERGFTSTQFHDFETASKAMRFGSVYTEPFSPENPSRDGISERCTTC